MVFVRAQRPLVEDVFLLPAVRKDVSVYQLNFLEAQENDINSKTGPNSVWPVFFVRFYYGTSS